MDREVGVDYAFTGVCAHAAAAHRVKGVGDAGDLGGGIEDFWTPLYALNGERREAFAEKAGEGAKGS